MTEQLPEGLTETGLVVHADHVARRCRVCGCTDGLACFDLDHGACWWIEPDLCSHCGEPAIVAGQYDRLIALHTPGRLMSDAIMLVWAQKARTALGRVTRTDPSAFEL